MGSEGEDKNINEDGITANEQGLIVKFKGQVEDLLGSVYEKSDLFLIRWIRARENDLEQAELMLRKSVQWRKEVQIDKLLSSMPEEYFKKNFPYWLNGVDLKGRPVLCIPMGNWDVKKAVDDGKIEEFVLYMARIYERIVQAIKDNNERNNDPKKNPITGFLALVDWDKFSVRQTNNLKAVQSLLQATAVFENHYPEILGDAIFINTNPVFQVLFALMKPILAPRTLGKIVCYGTNRKDWEPVVRNIVEEYQIPRSFGG